MHTDRQNNIILIVGPKHSGKTTVGRIAAGLFGGGFIDLDALIEKQTGKSPRTLFREGPEIFRKAEASALASILEQEAALDRTFLTVAAGGGLIDNPIAMERLEKSTALTIVYLEVSAETAWKRIIDSGHGELPPFLDTENPEKSHCELHKRRAKAYREKAHAVIEAENKSPLDISRELFTLVWQSNKREQ